MAKSCYLCWAIYIYVALYGRHRAVVAEHCCATALEHMHYTTTKARHSLYTHFFNRALVGHDLRIERRIIAVSESHADDAVADKLASALPSEYEAVRCTPAV
jgi:hypothetical protein